MKRGVVLQMFVIAVCLILGFTTGAQGVPPDQGPGSGAPDLDRNRPGDDRVGPKPRPIDPLPQPEMVNLVTDEFQLLGFTFNPEPANRGVFNYSLACRAEFGLSRMCTLEEINRTLLIPVEPGQGLAWINVTADLDVTAQMFAIDSSGLRAPVRPLNLNNCRGWTTNSPDHDALALDLGEFSCYGGLITVPCDQSLSVACCGPAPGK